MEERLRKRLQRPPWPQPCSRVAGRAAGRAGGALRPGALDREPGELEVRMGNVDADMNHDHGQGDNMILELLRDRILSHPLTIVQHVQSTL